jgi:O-antigen/teichoic acid export membrane protein
LPERVRDLKAKAVRGGVAKVLAQAATFVLRIGAIAVLARLLAPQEFGLVNMVTVITGVLSMLKDAGLPLATVQRATVSEEQLSTLFWLNLLVGALLTAVTMALAIPIAAFYRDPRLVAVAAALAPGFLLGSLGAQHAAILAREMRFREIAAIDVAALVAGAVTGIGMAAAGYGYWSLVGMALAAPAATSAGAWLVSRWVPGRPRRDAGIASMVHLGGTVTLNTLVVSLACNLDKALLGRVWGAGAVGLYGRAYQLASIPTENLGGAIGGVALSALSRLQDDAARLKSCFLKGYALVLALTVPVAIACALFADEIVEVVLGPRWHESAGLLRLLTPTILVFALINPTFWLLFALGLLRRSLRMALVMGPLVMVAYTLGLPYGPEGVAVAYSVALAAWALPHIAWCVHGTPVPLGEVMRAIAKPLLSGLVAAAAGLAFQAARPETLSAAATLALGGAVVLATYVWMLVCAAGQKALFLDLLAGLRPEASSEVP